MQEAEHELVLMEDADALGCSFPCCAIAQVPLYIFSSISYFALFNYCVVKFIPLVTIFLFASARNLNNFLFALTSNL